MPVYFPAFASTKLYCLVTEAVGVNNLAKVVTQQRRGWASNSRLLDRKSDALPLSHRAILVLILCESIQFYFRYAAKTILL